MQDKCDTNRRAFSPKEVARDLGVHENSVRNHIASGRLPARRFGRRVLIMREDLEKFLEMNRAEAL
jgi:excisionase family DNA binding protein